MPVYMYYEGLPGSTAAGGHRGKTDTESFSWGNTDGGSHRSVPLEDVLVSSYQSNGHAGAAVGPDLLAEPVVFDTCGGGTPTVLPATHDDPF